MTNNYSKEHQEILEQLLALRDKVDHLEQTLEFHVAQVHSSLVDRTEIDAADKRIEAMVRRNSERIGELTDAICGPFDSLKGIRTLDAGLAGKVDALHAKLANGGKVKASLSAPQQAAIYAAALGVILRMVFGLEIPLP